MTESPSSTEQQNQCRIWRSLVQHLLTASDDQLAISQLKEEIA